MTRISLDSSPRTWTQDLLLDPGAPAGDRNALRIASMGEDLGKFLVMMIAGVFAGAFLPFVMFPREQRHWADHFIAAAVGASFVLTLWVTALLFAGWCVGRVERPRLVGLCSRKTVGEVALVILLVLVFVVFLLSRNLRSAAEAVLLIPVLLLVLLLFAAPLLLAVYAAGRKVAFLALFVAVHMLIVLVACEVGRWLIS